MLYVIVLSAALDLVPANVPKGVVALFNIAPAFAAKGAFIKAMGLRGFNMWEAGGDFNDTLLDAISVAVGLQDPDDDVCSGDGNSTAPLSASSLPVPVATASVPFTPASAVRSSAPAATVSPADDNADDNDDDC